MPDIISLDLAGTLIDFYYFDYVWNEAIPQLYSQQQGWNIQKAKQWVLQEYTQIGTNDLRWYLPEYWFDRFKLHEDPDQIFQTHTDKIRIYPDVIPTLQQLHQQHSLILSSGVPRSIQRIILEQFPPVFSQTFSSTTDMQEPKKSTRFYHHICRTMAVAPISVLHCGDDWQTDVVAPQTIGITCYLLDRTAQKQGPQILTRLDELLALV